jgi:hypothetical protein
MGDFLKGDEGDDVIANSNGIDILMGGTGNDVVFVGVDSTEVFAGQGGDFVLGGVAADLLIGNEGDDWLEGGAGFDTTAGDNSELNFDSRIIGHDVMFAGSEEHDHDGESGDDIMVDGESVVRSEGMFGFDWVIHKGVQTAANVDMGIPIFTTEQADILRDRYDKVEAASGWKFNDILIGDDRLYDANANAPGNVGAAAGPLFFRDELDLAGRARIAGLDQVITNDLMFEGVYGSDWSNDVKQIFSGGNVLLGGGGSDLIAGKGGNDIIDGDRWLNVRISIKSPTNANVELATVDSLEHVFGAGSPAAWVGKSLFQLMIDRVIVPSQLQIVREVLNGNQQGDVDTVMFWDQIQNYSLRRANDGTVTVTHNTIGAVVPVLPNTTFLRVSDGVDTVRNIEVFRFGNGAGGFIDYTLGQLFPFAATGAPVISDTTPTEGNVLTADTSSIADLNGLGPFAFQWQSSTNGTTWININNATTFGQTGSNNSTWVGTNFVFDSNGGGTAYATSHQSFFTLPIFSLVIITILNDGERRASEARTPPRMPALPASPSVTPLPLPPARRARLHDHHIWRLCAAGEGAAGVGHVEGLADCNSAGRRRLPLLARARRLRDERQLPAPRPAAGRHLGLLLEGRAGDVPELPHLLRGAVDHVPEGQRQRLSDALLGAHARPLLGEAALAAALCLLPLCDGILDAALALLVRHLCEAARQLHGLPALLARRRHRHAHGGGGSRRQGGGHAGGGAAG